MYMGRRIQGPLYLDNVGPDNLLATGLDLGHKPVVGLLASEIGRHIVSRHVLLVQAHDRIKILLLHSTQALRAGVIGQRILANLVLRLAVSGKRAEANLVQLLPVECAVVVAAGADGLGEDDAGGVQALPDLVEVAAAGDFLDEDGGEALAAELLVDGQEVNLGAHDVLVADAQVDGNGGDEGDELAGLGGADADVVVLFPAGRHHGPISC